MPWKAKGKRRKDVITWAGDDLYCLRCESYVKPVWNWIRKRWECRHCYLLIAR